jgi:phosphoribosylglycinamide formyltransferase-1
MPKFCVAVLLSGSGSNLQSLIDAVQAGKLDADIRLVISNRSDAYGLERARKAGIPAVVVRHTDFPTREEYDAEMVRIIREHQAEAVVMAGFMRIVTPVLLGAFPGKVVNIHPALLPSFPGAHGQSDAADYGVRFSGCTVHFVDDKMDHGPIIIQAVVPSLPDDDADSLGARILRMEHRIYPQAVQWLAQGRLELRGRKVMLHNGKSEPDAARDAQGWYMVHPPLEDF